MKKTNQATLLLVALLGLTACGGGSSNETQNDVKQDQSNTQPQKKEITIVGSVEKGPFVIGSTVTINILNDKGENTDSTIVTKTTDDLGNFEFKVPAGSIIEISASGYYRNEITGGLSEGELTLRSIYKASETEKQNANVNLLTHLTSNRVLELIKAGESSFEQAIQQAEQEFTTNFKNVISSSNNANFASLSIYKDENSEASAYLLALSSMFYQHAINTAKNNQTSPDAELTAALNKLESDFGTDGKVDDLELLTDIQQTQKLIDPLQVQQNLFDWVSGKEQYAVPDINEFLDTDLDGIANNKDNDDDNDGIADEDDSSPHLADFIVEDKNISVLEDESITLDLTTNAPLGDEVKIIATQVKGPTNGELSGYFPEITYTPFNNFNGQDKFTLTLFQDGIESKPFTINVDVKAVNDAPTIEGQPEVNIIANNEYSFSPSISDIENNQLTVTVENLPEWLTLDSSTGMLHGTPTNAQVATYSNIQMSVSDGTTTSQLAPFSINVDYSTLAAPTNLKQTSSTKEKLQEIKLSWEKVEFAKSYTLEISLFEDFRTILQTEKIETNSITLEKEPNHYYWRVSTVNPIDQEGFSSEVISLEAGIFTKEFGGSLNDTPTKLISTKDNGFILLASTNSPELNANIDSAGDDWIFKTDIAGNLLWEYFHHTTGSQNLTDITELKDGSIVAVGRSWDSGESVIIKLNEKGQKVWVKPFVPTNPNYKQLFFKVTEAHGKLYVINQLSNRSDNSLLEFQLLAINSDNGDIDSQTTLNAPEGLIVNGIGRIFESKNGNLVISGSMSPPDVNSFELGGAFIHLLNDQLEVISEWNNAGQFSHLNSDYSIELENGSFAIVGQSTFAGISLSIIDSSLKQESNSKHEAGFDSYPYGSNGLSENSNGNFNTFISSENNNYLAEINSRFEILSKTLIHDETSENYFYPKGIIENHDGTQTILIQKTQKRSNKKSILLRKLKN
ncbi:putative Ig domain-containing protein [Pseudoalteromonas sp. SS15]|uniref:putative Ig domain-containing protein n=1 Tax=Pseudoalteromonas sp. SS15 TaxID=3139393 RepID=UPI003BA9E64F